MATYETWSEKAHCYDAEHKDGGTILYFECKLTGKKKEVTYHKELHLPAYIDRISPLFELIDKQ